MSGRNSASRDHGWTTDLQSALIPALSCGTPSTGGIWARIGHECSLRVSHDWDGARARWTTDAHRLYRPAMPRRTTARSPAGSNAGAGPTLGGREQVVLAHRDSATRVPVLT